MPDIIVQTPTPSEKPPMPAVNATLKQEDIQTQRIKPLYRGSQVVWYIVGLIEVLLMFRFFLKLFGANESAGFTMFINAVTSVFAGPFFLVFGKSTAGASEFEWSTLLAMVTYLLLGWLIVKAIVMSKPVTTEEAEKKLPAQDKV